VSRLSPLYASGTMAASPLCVVLGPPLVTPLDRGGLPLSGGEAACVVCGRREVHLHERRGGRGGALKDESVGAGVRWADRRNRIAHTDGVRPGESVPTRT
jgi:hypothetical protein